MIKQCYSVMTQVIIKRQMCLLLKGLIKMSMGTVKNNVSGASN